MVFFHLIEVAIVNAYILYVIQTKQDRQKILTHQKSRIQLAQQLLMDAGDTIPATQCQSSNQGLLIITWIGIRRVTVHKKLSPSSFRLVSSLKIKQRLLL